MLDELDWCLLSKEGFGRLPTESKVGNNPHCVLSEGAGSSLSSKVLSGAVTIDQIEICCCMIQWCPQYDTFSLQHK